MLDRAVTVKIGQDEYQLLLTLRATKEIGKKYGSLDGIGEVIFSKDWEDAIDDLTWLIALLINQTIMIRNLYEKANHPMVKPEDLELLIDIFNIAEIKNAIVGCFTQSTKREVESEEEEIKN